MVAKLETGWNDGVRYEACPKCGKVKIASYNIHERPDIKKSEDEWYREGNHQSNFLKMMKMGYGKYRGLYVCKNCKES
jgi:hypothetical protein